MLQQGPLKTNALFMVLNGFELSSIALKPLFLIKVIWELRSEIVHRVIFAIRPRTIYRFIFVVSLIVNDYFAGLLIDRWQQLILFKIDSLGCFVLHTTSAATKYACAGRDILIYCFFLWQLFLCFLLLSMICNFLKENGGAHYSSVDGLPIFIELHFEFIF